LTELARIGLDQIRQRLLEFPSDLTSDLPHRNNGIMLKKAAVLIPFVMVDQEWHLLFIQRAIHEKDRHSGQVAFAGGKKEESDTDLRITALREAHEEIGISPDDVTIIGELNYHYSISDFQITPVVANVPWPYELTLQSSEVAAAFTIPLKWLANPNNYAVRQREFDGKNHPVIYFNEYDGFLLWGATARITISLISLLQKA